MISGKILRQKNNSKCNNYIIYNFSVFTVGFETTFRKEPKRLWKDYQRDCFWEEGRDKVQWKHVVQVMIVHDRSG